MPLITDEHLVRAVQQLSELDMQEKERICDSLFKEQPALLGSVICLPGMGHCMEDVDALLTLLITLDLAVKASGTPLASITEHEQERQLIQLTKMIEQSQHQAIDTFLIPYLDTHPEPFILAFTIEHLSETGITKRSQESAKYLMLVAINLANCVAHGLAFSATPEPINPHNKSHARAPQ